MFLQDWKVMVRILTIRMRSTPILRLSHTTESITVLKSLESLIRKSERKQLEPKRQKEPRKTTDDTSGCVKAERVSKWYSSLLDT
jgi:hypothetical protein